MWDRPLLCHMNSGDFQLRGKLGMSLMNKRMGSSAKFVARVAARWEIVLLASIAVLATGLLVMYVPAIRRPRALFVVGVAIAALGLWIGGQHAVASSTATTEIDADVAADAGEMIFYVDRVSPSTTVCHVPFELATSLTAGTPIGRGER